MRRRRRPQYVASLTGLVVDERDAPSDATDAVGVFERGKRRRHRHLARRLGGSGGGGSGGSGGKEAWVA